MKTHVAKLRNTKFGLKKREISLCIDYRAVQNAFRYLV